ncbi:PREDICTED: translation initiation factor IF-2-like, partial [Rhagoletis zephyria]|uniref:translation initiation factor IF-2-like n=1 Tax=Rhagoletis zephyria TaxID=28612 RepID=UPI0008118BBD
SARQGCQKKRYPSSSAAPRQARQRERYPAPPTAHPQGRYPSSSAAPRQARQQERYPAPPTAHPQGRYPSSSAAPRQARQQERYPAPPTAQHQAHPQERYPSPSAAHDRRTEASSAPFNGVNRALLTRIEATPLPPNGPITGQEAVTQPLQVTPANFVLIPGTNSKRGVASIKLGERMYISVSTDDGSITYIGRSCVMRIELSFLDMNGITTTRILHTNIWGPGEVDQPYFDIGRFVVKAEFSESGAKIPFLAYLGIEIAKHDFDILKGTDP